MSFFMEEFRILLGLLPEAWERTTSLSGEAKDVLNVIVVGMFHAIEIHVIRALLNVF